MRPVRNSELLLAATALYLAAGVAVAAPEALSGASKLMGVTTSK